MATAVLNS